MGILDLTVFIEWLSCYQQVYKVLCPSPKFILISHSLEVRQLRYTSNILNL